MLGLQVLKDTTNLSVPTRGELLVRSENREKKNFGIKEKYFRISKSVDRSTPDSDFLELPKRGENWVLS